MEETSSQQTNQIAQPEVDKQTISWTASEYIVHEKSMGWHGILFGAAAVLAVAVFLISHDKLAVIVIVASAFAMSSYAKKKPSEKNYALNDTGITIDGQFYSYSEFRSFSVVEEGALDSIWLKRLNRLTPTIVMYFPPEDEEKIQTKLEMYLPFESRNLDLIDRFTKRIRF